MKAVFKFLWRASGVLVAINFAYYGIAFAGAWFGFNHAPSPHISTQALAFIGASMMMIDLNFPELRRSAQ